MRRDALAQPTSTKPSKALWPDMQLDVLLRELGLRVDEDVPPAVLRRISVDVPSYQHDLDGDGLAYDIPALQTDPMPAPWHALPTMPSPRR